MKMWLHTYSKGNVLLQVSWKFVHNASVLIPNTGTKHKLLNTIRFSEHMILNLVFTMLLWGLCGNLRTYTINYCYHSQSSMGMSSSLNQQPII